jgi:3-hydroxyacyl-CoA dehydrogenase
MENRLGRVAVIGAAGKMGNGIAWVLLQAMTQADAKAHGIPGSGDFELTLIDKNWEGLRRLRGYLRNQLQKFAEKRISDLREWAKDRSDLVENREIVTAFVEGALNCLRPDTHVEAAENARLVFEAVFEDSEVKKTLYTRLKALCPEAYFFTNTSSIPIEALDQGAGLEGKIIGYHFYNPPAVQKLVEVIAAKGTDPVLADFAQDLGKTLGKILVPSRDVAGFIGNGHFIREGLFAMEKLRALRATWEDPEAVFLVNAVTQDFLIRPMGMFQLIDYVGLDVFHMITQVMGRHIPGESFVSPVLTEMIAAGAKGGHAGSGEKIDGFFKYGKNKITGVYSLKAGRYVGLEEKDGFRKCREWLGPLPKGHAPWNKLLKDSGQKEKLAAYFTALAAEQGQGAKLAREFLARSRSIAETLVASGVAEKHEHVTSVLTLGFYHLYGPFDFAGEKS